MANAPHDDTSIEEQLRSARRRIEDLEAQLAHESPLLCPSDGQSLGLFREMRDAFVLHEIVRDKDGLPVNYRYLAVNPAFERLLDTTIDAIRGRCIDEVYADIEPHCWEAMHRVAQGGAPETFETYSEGLDSWYEVKALRPAEDRIAIFFSDISERKLAEARIRRDEERYALAMRGTRDGHWDWDIDTGEIYFSPRYMEMLGYGPEKVFTTGEEWISLVHPDDVDQVLAQNKACIDGKVEHFTLEFRMRHKTDGWRWVLGRGSGLQDEMGRVYRMAGTLSDVTERKRTEEELRAAKAAAEAANVAKTQFLANMSHEIRTPLNGVLGMLQLLREKGLNDGQRQYVDIALSSGQGLLRVLDDILNLSQVEAGALKFRAEPFDPCEVALSAGRLFDFQVRERGIDFEMQLDDAIGTVLGDDARLRQILVNVLGNAFKFTDRGRIELAVTKLPSMRENRTQVLFSVSDTGIGMPPERVKEAFGTFTQLDGSFTRRHQGVGLGLRIVKRLVEHMGGTLAVDSAPGEGTAIHISLSFATPRAPRRDESAAPTEALPAMTFVLAEDDPVNRLVATRLLEHLGHDVLAAKNGREALDLLAENRADAVFLDVQMPVMDGLEAVERIRKGTGGLWDPAIPVIAMTAHAMQTDRDKCRAAGMDAYIAKPVDMDDLTQTLEELFRRP